jgi:hypothetical protein
MRTPLHPKAPKESTASEPRAADPRAIQAPRFVVVVVVVVVVRNDEFYLTP